MATFSFEIPYVLPGQNQQLRMHFHQRDKIKLRCMQELMVAKSGARHRGEDFPKRLTKYHLIIERHGVQEHDQDNAVAAHKMLIDAMKEQGGMGLVLDDAPHQMLSITVVQMKCKKKYERTIIKLTEG